MYMWLTADWGWREDNLWYPINLYACMLHAHGFLSFCVGTFCIFDILPVVAMVHIEVLMICECIKK